MRRFDDRELRLAWLEVDEFLRNVDLVVRTHYHVFIGATFLDNSLQIHGHGLAVLPG
jgi:hypothetical protein